MWKIINEFVERPLRSSGSFVDSNKMPIVVYGEGKATASKAVASEFVISDFASDKEVVDAPVDV